MSRGWHSPFGPSLAFGHSRATHILSLRAERGLTWASSSVAVGHQWTSAQGDRHSGGSDFLSLERGSFRRPVPNCVQKGSSHLASVRWRKAIQGRGQCVQRQGTRVDLVGGLENIWCGWSSEVGGRKSGGQGQRGWQPFIPGAFPAKVKHISALAPEASVCYVVCLMPRFPRFVLHVGYFAV